MASSITDQLLEVDALLQKGLKTKAINKLQGLINTYPDILEYRDKLGQVYFDIQWYEKAGQYWILTETTSPEKELAITAFRASVNHSALQILRTLKFTGDDSALPKSVQKTFHDLQKECATKLDAVPTYTHRNTRSIVTSPSEADLRKENRKFWGCMIIVIFLGIAAIIGIIEILRMIWSLF